MSESGRRTRMDLASLAPLREVLASAGIIADKRFGQHFLLDLNICRRIVRLAALADGETVVEVGPGPGGLTRALLEGGARVVAIEKDPRFIPILAALAGTADGRLVIVEGDALRVDERAITDSEGANAVASVVANLPYNVGTPLLVKWLTGAFRPRSMTLMFQKEVASRIIAAPGEADYGRLAVLSQSLCAARVVMDLPARAFTPPPRVASAVVHLVPFAPRPSAALIEAVQSVTQSAFGQRRKMLRSALKSLGGEDLCRAAGVDPDARAETLSVAAFTRLAEAWMTGGTPNCT